MKIVVLNFIHLFILRRFKKLRDYIFDSQGECVYRAIRGLERAANRGHHMSTELALDALQKQFTNMTRAELKEIYCNYGVIENFNILD